MVEVPENPQPLVDAIWKALEDQDAEKPIYTGYGVSASSLGYDCHRRLWYDLRWASPGERVPGRTLRIFERGNIEEDRVVDLLKLAGLDVQEVNPATGRQWRFSLANGWIRGKADGVILSGVPEAPKAKHVLEIKSMKAADWRAIKKHGLFKKKPEHWHQLHSGMAGLNIDRGLYVASNKDTEEVLYERLHLNPEVADEKERTVLALSADDTPPARIADSIENFACRFCPHKAICHEAEPAPRSCRSCIHHAMRTGPNGHCTRHDVPTTPERQREGALCPTHLFTPGLVAGEQIDVDEAAEIITYAMQDGTEWADGGQDV